MNAVIFFLAWTVLGLIILCKLKKYFKSYSSVIKGLFLLISGPPGWILFLTACMAVICEEKEK